MPMRLASEAQASDLKIEQKDRARFVRTVAFFATVGCAWDWDRPFRSRRRVGDIGNHHDTACLVRLSQRVSSKGRRDAQSPRRFGFHLGRQHVHTTAEGPLRHAALSILRSFRNADGRPLEVVILRAAEENDVHQLPSAGNRFRVHIK